MTTRKGTVRGRVAYKLMRIRRDGTLGPLFINAAQRVGVGEWLPAKAVRTKGFAFRPGWHALLTPVAPHLKERDGRVWAKVMVRDYEYYEMPAARGGKWLLAKEMKVLEVLN